MKHSRVLAGFTGIIGAFFSLYILFVGPAGVNLWYQAYVTHLLVSGGTMLLMSEKPKATYFAAGSYLISMIFIVMQISSITRFEMLSFDIVSNFIFVLFIGASLTAFVLSFVSVFDKTYEKKGILKRTD